MEQYIEAYLFMDERLTCDNCDELIDHEAKFYVEVNLEHNTVAFICEECKESKTEEETEEIKDWDLAEEDPWPCGDLE